jgi:hypothetical protein
LTEGKSVPGSEIMKRNLYRILGISQDADLAKTSLRIHLQLLFFKKGFQKEFGKGRSVKWRIGSV